MCALSCCSRRSWGRSSTSCTSACGRCPPQGPRTSHGERVGSCRSPRPGVRARKSRPSPSLIKNEKYKTTATTKRSAHVRAHALAPQVYGRLPPAHRAGRAARDLARGANMVTFHTPGSLPPLPHVRAAPCSGVDPSACERTACARGVRLPSVRRRANAAHVRVCTHRPRELMEKSTPRGSQSRASLQVSCLAVLCVF